MFSEEIKTIIENIVIKYRFVFKEKQDAKKIFKVSMSSPVKGELVKNIKDAMIFVANVVNDVNNWSELKIKEEFAKRGLEEKKEKQKKTLVFPKLENVIEGKVITTYPPEPSKYPHIGHAYASYVNYLFARKHNGKFYIRFEDTNPKLVKNKYYDAQINAFNWLGIKPDKVIFASQYMDLFYEKAEQLIKKEKAYICTCNSETIRNNRQQKQECSCRHRKVKENLELWKKMLDNEFEEGKASLRLKLDMQSKRAEFRDPIIMRIIKAEHPKTKNKYVVWPAYILQNTILDCETGVSHRFRSKEFEPWKLVQKEIAKLLNYVYPVIYEYARVNLVGVKASGREMRKMVEEGKIDWDHPALTTIVALKRRGFLPEAIINFIDKMGLSKTESTIQWSVLESMNRKALAKKEVKNVVVLENPVEVRLEQGKGYIERTTPESVEFRVRHFANVIREGNKLNITSKEPKKGLKILNFTKSIEKIIVLMPSFENAKKELYIDSKAYKDLKNNEVVFLQGFGFARLEDKEKGIFVFTHK